MTLAEPTASRFLVWLWFNLTRFDHDKITLRTNPPFQGNLAQANEIPFAATAVDAPVWGTGLTPEGIDQNPVYYELVIDAPWRTVPIPDLTAYAVGRAHRRYNLPVCAVKPFLVIT
jgi:hypothetical protein